jgi:hypothetical protein
LGYRVNRIGIEKLSLQDLYPRLRSGDKETGLRLRTRGVGSQKRNFSADLIEVEIVIDHPIVLSADGTMRAAAGGIGGEAINFLMPMC